MSTSKSDTEIILNKANIALARSQRLVASWLPAQPAQPAIDQLQEDELFTAIPETLGVGAPLPPRASDGSWNRTEIDSNDALRRQLLGRNYKKIMAEKVRQKTSEHSSKGLKSREGFGSDDADDDDDEGRTALIGRKLSAKRRKLEAREDSEPTTQAEEGGDGESKGRDGEGAYFSTKSQTKGRKKTTSFLDEFLAERSRKRKKR
ncbi:hypothetical protein BJX70DRAFT_404011 [Aspergillus crustosus]